MIGRGAITLLAWLCYFTAARTTPLAQLLTLYFSAPLMTAVLAIPLLGERVTGTRWISLGLAFAGVLLASDPFGVEFTLATLLVLIAAALWGYSVILMRQAARRGSSVLIMFYQNAMFMVVTGIMAAFTWEPTSGFQLALMLTLGVLGGFGQFALFEGARYTPAAVMATMEYIGLPWAFVLGYVVFGDIPTLAVTAGAVLIMSAGVVLVVTERQKLLR